MEAKLEARVGKEFNNRSGTEEDWAKKFKEETKIPFNCYICFIVTFDAWFHQSMVEPSQRPSAGAMGHHPRCFATQAAELGAGTVWFLTVHFVVL